MKKLLYTIALAGGVTFLPAAQGMDSDENARQAVERARARITQIEQEEAARLKDAQAEVCSFDYQQAMSVLTQIEDDVVRIRDDFWMRRDSFNKNNYPKWAELEAMLQLPEYSQHDGSVLEYLTVVSTILKDKGVSRISSESAFTKDQMKTLLYKANNLVSMWDSFYSNYKKN